jgi:predicted DNA-binding protein
MKTTTIGFRLPEKLAEKIKALAKLERRSVSNLIRLALERYLNTTKK